MRNLTVIFYIDADKAVETFVEEVTVKNISDALAAGVKSARASGSSSSGHQVAEYEWANATEIAILEGHRLAAR